jgi:hypothetical protein
MVKTVSTRFALASLAAVAGLTLVGCVDARGSYDEFGDRLVDAGNGDVDGDEVDVLPNVDGEWRLVVHPVNLPEDKLLFFDVTFDLTTVTANTGKLEMIAQPLNYQTLVAVGDAFEARDRNVKSDATFDAPFIGQLPGEANSVTQATVNVDAELTAVLKSDDFVCGMLSGQAGVLPLDGTTWAAVRVDAATDTHIFRCEDQPQ